MPRFSSQASCKPPAVPDAGRLRMATEKTVPGAPTPSRKVRGGSPAEAQAAEKAAGAVVRLEEVQQALVEVRGQKGLLDSSVAGLYGVETRRINEAVSRNPDKFPAGYVIQLTAEEWSGMKSQFATSLKFPENLPKNGGKVKPPAVFTEKGLYMLATGNPPPGFPTPRAKSAESAKGGAA